jgi:hypothetical protein
MLARQLANDERDWAAPTEARVILIGKDDTMRPLDVKSFRLFREVSITDVTRAAVASGSGSRRLRFTVSDESGLLHARCRRTI